MAVAKAGTVVYNAAAMEEFRAGREAEMNAKIGEMGNTISEYERTAAQLEAEAVDLEEQAADQDVIALYATMTVYYTDAKGNKCSKSVPDTAKRSQASSQATRLRSTAAEKRRQAADLRAQIIALNVSITTLKNTISVTNNYIRNLSDIVQRTDLTYAQKLQAITAEIQDFTQKMKGIYNSFSVNSLDIWENVNDNPSTGVPVVAGGVALADLIFGGAVTAYFIKLIYDIYNNAQKSIAQMEENNKSEDEKNSGDTHNETNSSEQNNSSNKGSQSKTIDDILEGATPGRKTMGRTDQWDKSGGYEQALDDFNSLNPSDVHDIETRYGGGKAGKLSDGTKVDVRPGSTAGPPTLEFQDGRNRVKIRYIK